MAFALPALPAILCGGGTAAESGVGVGTIIGAIGFGILSTLSGDTPSGIETADDPSICKRGQINTVRVQLRGYSVTDDSISLSNTRPITAREVNIAITQLALGTLRKDMTRASTAFVQATRWVNKKAAEGGNGPVTKNFPTNAPNKSRSRLRVDVEVLRGWNLVP